MSFLKQLRQSCEARRIPLISPETQNFLVQKLQDTKPQQVLEIGAAIGYSSIVIGQTISVWGGQLCSFEISYPAYLEALKNTTATKNITLYPFDINEIRLETFFSERFDFVFIDAQKNQYGDYVQKIQKVLCSENTVILDDVIKYQNKLS
jgi:predicted O-methyltransferase YrrM